MRLFVLVALLAVYPAPFAALALPSPPGWLCARLLAGQPDRAPSAAHNFVNLLDYANGRVTRSPVTAS